jgi:peroxiredoxin
MRNTNTAVWLTALSILTTGMLGCSIERAPSEPTALETGLIYISAEDPYGHQVLGAAIYVDGDLRPEISPDTLNLTTGNHQLRLESAAFHPLLDTILVEADTLIQHSCTLIPLNTNVGSVIVSAMNQTNSQEITGGEIYLNGASTGQFTSDTLENIPVGQQTIGVGMLGFDYTDSLIEVTSGVATALELSMSSVPWNGIQVISNQDPALVCLDDQLTTSQTPWVLTGIANGLHSFSCYREGFATLNDTLSPALQTANLFHYGHEQLTFNLESWAGGVGQNVGQLAPGFTLQSDFLDSVSLGALRGRVVLLTFWFSNCVPCMEEMPEIQDAYEELSPLGFRVLAINYMLPDNLQTVQQIRQQLGITFEFLLDYGYVVTEQYGVFQFPTNILIDQRGVVNQYVGSLTHQWLTEHVQALLNP